MSRRTATGFALIAALLLFAAPVEAKKSKPKLGPVVTEAATAVSTGNVVPTTATATCPVGRKAVGGGWNAPPPLGSNNGLFVFESVRAGDSGWTTQAIGVGAMGSHNALTTYVYCRRVKKGIEDVIGTAPIAAQIFATATATATCPGKKKLIAGGFSSASTVIRPYESAAAGDTWVYRAQNSGSGAGSLTVHAYCTKGVRSATVEAAAGADYPGSSFAVSPPCTGKKRVSAGGFLAGPTPVNPPVDNRIHFSSWLSTLSFPGTQQKALTAQGICTR